MEKIRADDIMGIIGPKARIGIGNACGEPQGSIRLPPPLLGQHTQEILSDHLGYSEKEIDALRQEGVI